MNVRKKLVELIGHEVVPYFAERIADHLIANGVTIAEDTNVLTNADRIRAEDDDEMKTEIHAFSCGFKPWCDYHCENEGDDGCDKCIEKWLRQPAEE